MKTELALPVTLEHMTSDGYLECAQVVFDANHDEVCRVDYRQLPTGAPGIKNSGVQMAAIVRAVNSHADLVAALDNLLISVEGKHVTVGDCNQARAALAKARS